MEFSTQRNNNLLTLEYLEDGSRSPIVSQSPRELFARVTHLTSSFASTAALATSDGLQGKLLHMRDVRIRALVNVYALVHVHICVRPARWHRC